MDHATKPAGRYYEARKWVSYGCLAILFLIPFIKVNGNPLLLLKCYWSENS